MNLSKILSSILSVSIVTAATFTPVIGLEVTQAHAANYINTLSSVSDTLTTSRPSASTPLSADVAPGTNTAAYELPVYNNGSRFLASDSAQLVNKTSNNFVLWGAGSSATLTVASQSADLTKVYLNSPVNNAITAPNGVGIVMNPITAMHTVKFTTSTAVPSNGKIVLNFPAQTAQDSSNTASPSATTFQTNGLISGNIKVNNATGTWGTLTNPNSLTFTLTAPITPGTTVTFLIGCSAATGAVCNTQVPTLINPTKIASAGISDQWKLTIQTQDNTSAILDQGITKINTIDSVQVQAAVDATFTFTIAGNNAGSALNLNNATGCTSADTSTASNNNASATLVDLGFVAQGLNTSNQIINISTNGLGGYALTATASGHLINPGNGYFFPDSAGAAGSVITGGTTWFGIRGCGADANTTTFGANAKTGNAGGAGVLFAWPTSTQAINIAQYGNATAGLANPGNGVTSIQYAATASTTFPAGAYSAYVSYTATPTF